MKTSKKHIVHCFRENNCEVLFAADGGSVVVLELVILMHEFHQEKL